MNEQPKNIFEVINLNIVDLSKDIVILAEKINAIYDALYPDGAVQKVNENE
jgi:hypothetical protein